LGKQRVGISDIQLKGGAIMRRKDPKFDLRLKHKKTVELSLIIALILVAGVFLASKEFQLGPRIKHVESVVIKVEDIPPPTDQKHYPPAPPRPLIPIVDPTAEIEPALPVPINVWRPTNRILPPPPIAMEGVVPFVLVEKPPVLIGGVQAIAEYIQSHDLYPQLARTSETGGSALIYFTVGKDGRVIDAEIGDEKPAGLGFGEAALQAMLAMRFTPGMQRDKAVKVRMQQAVHFRIN
jgi:protein TonB